MKTASELASRAWRERSAHEGLSERETVRLVERAQEDARDDGARDALAAVRNVLKQFATLADWAPPRDSSPTTVRKMADAIERSIREYEIAAGLVTIAPGAIEANEEARK